MAARHWRRSGDEDFLREFYPSLKKATLFTFTVNPSEPYGLISLPEFDMQEGYESRPFKGMTSHVASLRLYHLKMMAKMADAVGDTGFADQCRQWSVQAVDLLARYMAPCRTGLRDASAHSCCVRLHPGLFQMRRIAAQSP